MQHPSGPKDPTFRIRRGWLRIVLRRSVDAGRDAEATSDDAEWLRNHSNRIVAGAARTRGVRGQRREDLQETVLGKFLQRFDPNRVTDGSPSSGVAHDVIDDDITGQVDAWLWNTALTTFLETARQEGPAIEAVGNWTVLAAHIDSLSSREPDPVEAAVEKEVLRQRLRVCAQRLRAAAAHNANPGDSHSSSRSKTPTSGGPIPPRRRENRADCVWPAETWRCALERLQAHAEATGVSLPHLLRKLGTLVVDATMAIAAVERSRAERHTIETAVVYLLGEVAPDVAERCEATPNTVYSCMRRRRKLLAKVDLLDIVRRVIEMGGEPRGAPAPA